MHESEEGENAMADYKVDTDRLRSQADELEALRGSLNEVALKLSGMQLGSIIQMKASTKLIGKVADCKWAAIRQSGDLGQLSRGLDTIADTYDNIEKNLSEPKTKEQAEKAAGKDDINFDWLIKIIGSTTPITGLISLFYYGAEGINGDGLSIVKALKQLTSAIGDAGKLAIDGGSKAEWAETLLGETLAAKEMTDTGFVSFLKKELDKYKFSAQKTTGKKFKVATKWAGVLLTAATNAISNYNEFNGDLSNVRFWEETVMETGIDVGKGILLSAAVGAAATAICATTPVWVVAIGSTVASMVLDAAAKKVFGKSATELVSDGILDTVHAVASWLGSVTNGASYNVVGAW